MLAVSDDIRNGTASCWVCWASLEVSLRMKSVFAAAIPDHWCALSELNTQSSNSSVEELKELLIPKEEKNGELVFSSCLAYDDIWNGTISNDERKAKKCSKWTYDQSVYKSTAVTEVTCL